MIHLVLLLSYLSGSIGLPKGAPTKVCKTLTPFHSGGLASQKGQSPYGMVITNRNGDLLVTVKSPLELPFKGIMLQARDPDGNSFGSFEPIESEVHTIDCDEPGDTITHNDPKPKKSVDVRWKPPAGYDGPVIFNSTVAQDYATFWVGVESASITKISDVVATKTPSKSPTTTTPSYSPEQTSVAPSPTDPFYQDCGIKKLCFGNKNGCIDNQNCEAIAAVTVAGDRYEIELKALGNPAWVGMGLSNDNRMGNDSVVECVREGSAVRTYLSWTIPRPNLNALRDNISQRGIHFVTGNVIDGALYCKVQRDVKTTIKEVEFDLANNKYYILVAAGSEIHENQVGFHNLAFEVSAEARFLSDASKLQGASKLLLRLHGAFMLAAWIGTASIGTLIARYYRKTWVGKQICGKDVWFAWHRLFMLATWALTTVGFVLIFVELKEWTKERNPHGILGCVVTALCYIQPIGAFFRPHPGTPKRPIFNWLHWLGGNSAHIIAIITIFFAVKLNKAELPSWFDWIMVAYVAFHVIMHLLLSILGCMSDRSSNQRVTAFPMKDLQHGGKITAQMISMDAPYTAARKTLLGLYVVFVGGLAAALILVVAFAPIST